jgi:hypothetical protein
MVHLLAISGRIIMAVQHAPQSQFAKNAVKHTAVFSGMTGWMRIAHSRKDVLAAMQ